MRKTLILETLLISICIIACGEQDIQPQTKTIQQFCLDSNTVHKDSIPKDDVVIIQDINNNYTHTEDEEQKDIGELILENNDNSKDYEIDGDDIIYNGIRFKYLNKEIKKVNTKYDNNTLLNFIIKTCTIKQDIIYASYSDVKNSDDEYVIDFDNDLMGMPTYEILKNKYNEEISWVLDLSNVNIQPIQICGAYNYILLVNSNSNVVINMDEYDSHSEYVPEQGIENNTQDTEYDNPETESNDSETESDNSETESNDSETESEEYGYYEHFSDEDFDEEDFDTYNNE